MARQLELVGALLALPRDLLDPLAVSIREGAFSSPEWTDYAGELASRGSTFAGSAQCTGCSIGASGVWTTYWARDRKAWARGTDVELAKAMKALRRVAQLSKKLPRDAEVTSDDVGT